MKKAFKNSAVLCASLMALGVLSGLTSCGGKEVVVIWGPGDHEQLYLQYAAEFAEKNEWDVTFEFADKGDSGAYSNMSIDPQAGASVYTYANDMLINLNRIGALSPIMNDELTQVQAEHLSNAIEAGKIGERYFGYPVTADNGYFMYYNAEAFRGTAVWDSETDALKADYTFRDLYSALQSKTDKWNKGLVTWAAGDAWYVSGMFFGAGGDYEVTYDDQGNQSEGTKCWFAYEVKDGVEDYTVGRRAAQGFKNSIVPGLDSKNYLYSDATSLNTNIGNYLAHEETPLAAAVCGTWKGNEFKNAWGENTRAMHLPKLEDDAGNKFTFKTFSGYKLMGVNPLSEFNLKSEENLAMSKKLALYLTGAEVSIARYESTGAGPSNLEALKNEEIKKDYALLALNDQFEQGSRVQDSVPSNYWTPIETFGKGYYNYLATGTNSASYDDENIERTLKNMQNEIIEAAQ